MAEILAERRPTGEIEMRRMISMMSMPALFLIGMTALSPAKAKQDAGKEAQKSIADLEQRVKELEQKVADQQDEMVRFARFADGVAIGVARLGAAGDASREHGFESAGPNPSARTDLLDGIKSLQDSVRKSLEKSDAEKAKEAKQREEQEKAEKEREEQEKEAKHKEGGGN
jgi:septal ring factor EnvC (AmiA/AmiB activator)